MRTNIITGFCFVVTVLDCYAQKMENKNSLNISLGPSFPIGEYASTNFQSDQSGFAKTGEHMSVCYSRKIGKYSGLAATVYAQRNPLDTRAIEKKFSETRFNLLVSFSGGIPPQPSPAGPYIIYPNWKFEKSTWSIVSFMAGGFREFYIQKNQDLSFETRAMFGIVYVSSPRLKGNSVTDTTTAQTEQTSVSAFGFSYLFRGVIKYNVSNNISIQFCIDYLGTSKIKFNDVKASFFAVKNTGGFPSVTQATVTGNAHQKIQAVNPGVGIGISF